MIKKAFVRWSSSLLKKSSWGRRVLSYLQMRQKVFSVCFKGFGRVGEANAKAGADRIYTPFFENIFLLQSAYRANGLRGDILEFGVLYGYTSQLFAKMIKQFHFHDCRLHLFDSFEGLPANQGQDHFSYESVNKQWFCGAMKVEERIPNEIQKRLTALLGKERVYVVKGFFEESCLKHIERVNIQKALIVHLDCDLYSSTKFVLKTLIERNILQEGTIVICDDWMCSFGNPNFGQQRALSEIKEEYPYWHFEKYLNYGIGSQAFVIHDKRITKGTLITR